MSSLVEIGSPRYLQSIQNTGFGFRRNDKFYGFSTFYEVIKIGRRKEYEQKANDFNSIVYPAPWRVDSGKCNWAG